MANPFLYQKWSKKGPVRGRTGGEPERRSGDYSHGARGYALLPCKRTGMNQQPPDVASCTASGRVRSIQYRRVRHSARDGSRTRGPRLIEDRFCHYTILILYSGKNPSSIKSGPRRVWSEGELGANQNADLEITRTVRAAVRCYRVSKLG